MMKTNEERLQDILDYLSSLTHVKTEDIPGIDLYMDQVTTFMDEHLKETRRHPDDKVLTKTMINNYAKNNLLPPPVKKKYSKDHILFLIFIYYFKNLLSFNDIEELFRPITARHFSNEPPEISLEDIYKEVFALEETQLENLTKDLMIKFEEAQNTFSQDNVNEEDREYLKLFAFICELSFDVYLKKQMIEMITDQLRTENLEIERKKK